MTNGTTQITTLRLPDGKEIAFVDWQDKPVYSTIDLLSGFSDRQLTLFTYAIGDPVAASSNVGTRRTATKRDTNVATPGSTAGTEEILVYSIKPEMFFVRTDGNTPANLNTAQERALGEPIPSAQNLAILNRALLLRFQVSQTIMHEAGLGYYNTGFGAVAFGLYNTDAAAAIRSIGSQGLPSQEAVRSYAIPIHVGGTEKYQVFLVNEDQRAIDFTTEVATPLEIDAGVMQVRVHLDGLYKRPVS